MKCKTFFVSILLIISALPSALLCQSNPSDSSKFVTPADYPAPYSIAIGYVNKFIFTKESYFDNVYTNGYNFVGISLTNIIKLNSRVSLKPEMKFQIGTINGRYATDLMIQPGIMVSSTFVNITAGAGFSLMSVKNRTVMYGGIGSCASLSFDIPIISKFSVFFDCGFQSYQNASYNSFELGGKYTY